MVTYTNPLSATPNAEQQKQIDALRAREAANIANGSLDPKDRPVSPTERALQNIKGTGDRDYEIDRINNDPLLKQQDKEFWAANPQWYTSTGKSVPVNQDQFDAYQTLVKRGQVDGLDQEALDTSANTHGIDTTGVSAATTQRNPNTGVQEPIQGAPTETNNNQATGNAVGDALNNAVNTPTAANNTATATQNAITNPQLPAGATVNPVQQTVQPNEVIQGTLLDGQAPQVSATAVQAPEAQQASTYQAAQNGTNVPQVDAAQGTVNQNSLVDASQIAQGTGQATASQGQVDQTVQAQQIAQGTGQGTAAQGTLSDQAQVTAAQGTESQELKNLYEQYNQDLANAAVDPRATVQEQYNQLMNFDAGDVPTWAQGALRTANAQMAARGITNTTIAANATFTSIVQAAMPIAQQDAKVFQTFQLETMSQKQASVFLRAGQLAELNTQNLANRQQAAVVNAQSALTVDMANLSNEQQMALQNAQAELQVASTNTGYAQQAAIENARNSLNMNLANLSAENQVAIENARNSLTLESQNLNARQQAAQFNASAFLQMDMTNLSNRQQAAIVNAQGRLQALMTDTAAQNAALQFNASSENQTNQFFAQLANSTSIFNATQALSTEQFNAEMTNQRDQFNAKLATEIEQSNVIYQRQINTQYTADQNQANLINAQNLLGISNQAIADNLTMLRDDAHYAFTSAENAQDRAVKLAQQKMINDTNILLFDKEAAFKDAQGTGDLVGGLVASFGSSLINNIFSGGSSSGSTSGSTTSNSLFNPSTGYDFGASQGSI